MIAFQTAMVTSYLGDNRAIMQQLEPASVQTVVTSPPYFNLRDYKTGKWEGGSAECDHRKVSDAVAAVATSTLGGGKKTTGHLQEGFKDVCGKCGARRIDNQIGLEKTPADYINALVAIFREVHRVLKDTGTLWLNLGDSYAGSMKGMGADGQAYGGDKQRTNAGSIGIGRPDWSQVNMKPKDLMMIPARVAIALQDDGWYLRSDIIWSKPNVMPESVTDRPTNAHEHIFLLAKSRQYYYDADAIKEPLKESSIARDSYGYNHAYRNQFQGSPTDKRHQDGKPLNPNSNQTTRNKRNVWEVATQPCKDAHFATFPPKLIEPCILAGSKPGDVVLDPFGGSGTTAMVATAQQRHGILIDLNPEYIEIQKKRLKINQATIFDLEGVAVE